MKYFGIGHELIQYTCPKALGNCKEVKKIKMLQIKLKNKTRVEIQNVYNEIDGIK
jgi:hypothetical protein